MLSLYWTKKTFKQMSELPRIISKQIFTHVNYLQIQPFSPNLDIKKMAGQPWLRLRVGDYRIVFQIDKEEQRIIILFVGHRNNVYKRI